MIYGGRATISLLAADTVDVIERFVARGEPLRSGRGIGLAIQDSSPPPRRTLDRRSATCSYEPFGYGLCDEYLNGQRGAHSQRPSPIPDTGLASGEAARKSPNSEKNPGFTKTIGRGSHLTRM